MKYYNDGYSELSFTKKSWKDYLLINGLNQIKLYEQKRDVGSGLCFCLIYQNCFSNSEGECGQHCNNYDPRNHKNGRCRFSSTTLIDTGKIVMLFKNGRMKEV